MSTPHNSANLGDFAKTVLMPGDPLRAKFIAETFLKNAKLVNNVRGIQGYTGEYNGKPVSVMASGMGQPSIGIYSYELFKFYGVENIIRVGSCGGLTENLHVKDVILAMGACTNGNYFSQYGLNGNFSAIASYELLKTAEEAATSKNITVAVGNVLSSDIFYDEASDTLKWAELGVLGVEMEAAALYVNAARLNKRALAILTVSDSFVHANEITTPLEREKSFTDMIMLALETAIKF